MKNILSILVQDRVCRGLQEKYNLSETAARQIVDSLVDDIQEKFDNGESFMDVAKYLIDVEHSIDNFQKNSDMLVKISDFIVNFTK